MYILLDHELQLVAQIEAAWALLHICLWRIGLADSHSFVAHNLYIPQSVKEIVSRLGN